MNTTTTHRLTLWQATLAKLLWSPKDAEQSAKSALSRAQRLGLDTQQAIQWIFEIAMDGFFQEHPHIPFQVWQSEAKQIACLDERGLRAA